jgi:hypothetical protein
MTTIACALSQWCAGVPGRRQAWAVSALCVPLACPVGADLACRGSITNMVLNGVPKSSYLFDSVTSAFKFTVLDLSYEQVEAATTRPRAYTHTGGMQSGRRPVCCLRGGAGSLPCTLEGCLGGVGLFPAIRLPTMVCARCRCCLPAAAVGRVRRVHLF